MRGNDKSASEICDETLKLATNTVSDVRKYLDDLKKADVPSDEDDF